MSPAVGLGVALFLAAVALFLAQVWFEPLSPELFLKLMLTDGVLLAVVVVGGFLLRERAATRRLRDGKDMD